MQVAHCCPCSCSALCTPSKCLLTCLAPALEEGDEVCAVALLLEASEHHLRAGHVLHTYERHQLPDATLHALPTRVGSVAFDAEMHPCTNAFFAHCDARHRDWSASHAGPTRRQSVTRRAL